MLRISFSFTNRVYIILLECTGVSRYNPRSKILGWPLYMHVSHRRTWIHTYVYIHTNSFQYVRTKLIRMSVLICKYAHNHVVACLYMSSIVIFIQKTWFVSVTNNLKFIKIIITVSSYLNKMIVWTNDLQDGKRKSISFCEFFNNNKNNFGLAY